MQHATKSQNNIQHAELHTQRCHRHRRFCGRKYPNKKYKNLVELPHTKLNISMSGLTMNHCRLLFVSQSVAYDLVLTSEKSYRNFKLLPSINCVTVDIHLRNGHFQVTKRVTQFVKRHISPSTNL